MSIGGNDKWPQEKDRANFLMEDYKQKIGYLTAHLSRMWQRFNFFVVMQAAVSTLIFTSNREFSSTSIYLVIVALLLAAIWWIFGAQDRYLVRVYRKQVKDSGEKLIDIYNVGDLYSDSGEYRFVGDTEGGSDDLHRVDAKANRSALWRLIEWRSSLFSITTWAAIFPLIFMVVWATLFVILLLGLLQRTK